MLKPFRAASPLKSMIPTYFDKLSCSARSLSVAHDHVALDGYFSTLILINNPVFQ